jgi:hypothetical protein
VIGYVKVQGKMIARDLGLVASGLHRMAVIQPWIHHVPLTGTLTTCRYRQVIVKSY